MASTEVNGPPRPLDAGEPLQSTHARVIATTPGGVATSGAFPEPLNPAFVTTAETVVGDLFLHSRNKIMTPIIRETGKWEEMEMKFLRSVLKPGHTFLDVGANIGYFSIFASAIVGSGGRVVAVEPEQRNLQLLRANVWRNRCNNTIVLPVAAYRETGFLPMRRDEKNRGNHQVGRSGKAHELVPCARLEDLLGPLEIDVVKVDTQGTDHDAIAGLGFATDASARRPTVLCEFWPQGMDDRGVAPSQVLEMYMDMGFQLSLLTSDGRAHPTGPAEIESTARASKYVNLVLR